ncbi:hypothetical protein BAL199_28345 [alpha proteobacterium BAL199]|jgi:hypothetical protein|nr:hypothetical protein BAL199_28345 [alpha proteobacterium BAL199]
MTYDEFWPRYLRQHRHATTRRVHVIGTTVGAALLLAAVVTLDWRLLVAALVVGYGGAWLSHALVEKNRPETFSYPFWSLANDLRMTWLYLNGRLQVELERHGIR